MTHEFYVAGVKHHSLHKIIFDLKPNDELDLVPEPENTYDSNAIKVLKDNLMLGYVPAKIAKQLNPLPKNAKCVVVNIKALAEPWKQLWVRITT
jgi:hypothetical protein